MKFITKKNCSLAGMICGLLVIVLGIVILAGGLGGDTYRAGSAPSSYDSGYASFGGDFYTYACNNAAEAASGSQTAANNLHYLGEFLRSVFGYAMIAFGLFTLCLFGCRFAECIPAPAVKAAEEKAEEKIEEKAEEVAEDAKEPAEAAEEAKD